MTKLLLRVWAVSIVILGTACGGGDAKPDAADYECVATAECTDGDPCNGTEICDVNHTCQPGTALADGAACSTATQAAGVCRSSMCVSAGCGNGVVDGTEECDDMNATSDDGCEIDCTFSCKVDADCTDATVCNGAETCNQTTHVCAAGTALTCDDSIACTTNMCDAVNGCTYPLIDADGDGYASSTLGACGTDCNDGNPAAHPGAAEVAGDALNVDENCDAIVTCYSDGDTDGYRTTTIVNSADGDCADTGEAFASLAAGDCNDSNPAVSPGDAEVVGDAGNLDENCNGVVTCYANSDNDTYRTSTSVSSADADCGDSGEAYASLATTDCNDMNATVYPGATEVAGDVSNLDENCNGVVTCFANMDNDAYRSLTVINSADVDCSDLGEAYSSVPSVDCNDGNANVFPGATEVTGDAADLDENCNGVVTCFANADNDGYRTATSINSGDADCLDLGEAYASLAAGDCLDTNAAVSPGDPEVFGDAGDLDENCDGFAGCYTDADNDGYRLTTTFTDDDADCADSFEGRASDAIDCADADAAINPGAAEIFGNNVDEQCDGRAGCYVDGDNDGARTAGTFLSTDADCNDANEGLLADSLDCADADGTRYPGALELCNTVDEDCDGAPRNTCPSANEVMGTTSYFTPHGGSSGSLVSFSCGTGTVLVGFDIYTDAFGPWVNGIRRVCRAVQIDETVASPEYDYDLNWAAGSTEILGGTYGSTMGTLTQMRCATNQAVSRVSGRAGALVDQLSISCSHYSLIRSGAVWVGDVTSFITWGPYGGTGGAAWGPDACADASVGVGHRLTTAACGASGTCLESFGVGCATLGYTPQ